MIRQATYALLVGTVAICVLPQTAVAQLLAFPGAEGAGRYAKGGRDGDVYIVNNLNNSGQGSLRHAIDTSPAAGRMIVFSVGGTIDLTSDITIDSPNITIAGQSAPGGITLARRALRISDTHDVVVQHIAVRPGDFYTAPNQYEPDSIWVPDSENVILDHVSASWSTDEVLSVTHGSTNVTVQWSMITEALHNSNHSKGNAAPQSVCPQSFAQSGHWQLGQRLANHAGSSRYCQQRDLQPGRPLQLQRRRG
jgi:pectate lyase